MKTAIEEPKLAPPGAGLPFPQRFFLRYLLGPVGSKLRSPARTRSVYESTARELIEIVSATAEKKRSIKILIRPIRGLEDSSRYWSLNGVLEHLLLVSKRIEIVILALSAGVVPPGQADPAKVKPVDPEKDHLPEFISYAPDLLKRIDEKIKGANMNFSTQLKFTHPWFGPLTAKQWYWFLAGHQSIHVRQARAIREKCFTLLE
jgi:hypothetical protein